MCYTLHPLRACLRKLYYVMRHIRYRPFYVAVASPQPKDLVVVIDTSGSMSNTHHGRTLMEIAIEAASTVVDTLGPNDRVST